MPLDRHQHRQLEKLQIAVTVPRAPDELDALHPLKILPVHLAPPMPHRILTNIAGKGGKLALLRHDPIVPDRRKDLLAFSGDFRITALHRRHQLRDNRLQPQMQIIVHNANQQVHMVGHNRKTLNRRDCLTAEMKIPNNVYERPGNRIHLAAPGFDNLRKRLPSAMTLDGHHVVIRARIIKSDQPHDAS